MARIHTSRWWIGLTAILATSFLAFVGALVFSNWPHPAKQVPRVRPSATEAAPEPSVSVLDRPVPLVAYPMSDAVVASVVGGWVLVAYDSSTGDYVVPVIHVTPDPDDPSPGPTVIAAGGPAEWEHPGPVYLYVIDPSGTAYAAGDLGVDTGERLLAWLPNHRTAIVSRPADGGATLHTYDLVTEFLSPAFGGATPLVWRNPEVRVSETGQSLLVRSSGSGEIARLALDGTPVDVPVDASAVAGYVESADGNAIVVAERVTVDDAPAWTIASYSAPGTSIVPNQTPSPSPSASASPSPVEWTRVDHGLPAGETSCVPVSWPEDRQLLILCDGDDGSPIFYTLAPRTDTFVDVLTLDPGEGEAIPVLSADGTRIVLGRTVFNLFGEPVWSIDAAVSTPTNVVWSGDLMVAWTERADAGSGAAELDARHGSDGSLAYVIPAIGLAAGFVDVVGVD